MSRLLHLYVISWTTRLVKMDSLHTITSGFNQGQCFELTSQQHLLQVSIGRVKSDVAHIPNHYVLHTDIILPETWKRGGRRGWVKIWGSKDMWKQERKGKRGRKQTKEQNHFKKNKKKQRTTPSWAFIKNKQVSTVHKDSLVMAHAKFRQIRKFLDADDGVVQRWLEWLGHCVGQDHSNHHRQDVGNLTSQLKHYDCSGYSVGDCSRQRGSTCVGGKWFKEKSFFLSSLFKAIHIQLIVED